MYVCACPPAQMHRNQNRDTQTVGRYVYGPSPRPLSTFLDNGCCLGWSMKEVKIISWSILGANVDVTPALTHNTKSGQRSGIYAHACMYVRTYALRYLCMYVCIVCICMYVHKHACMDG